MLCSSGVGDGYRYPDVMYTRPCVTVTVTKVFILRFLLKDRKRITELVTYIQRKPG